MGNKDKATMHKKKGFSDYIYSSATLYCKVCLMSVKLGNL